MSAIYGCCCCCCWTNTLIYRFNDEACWQTGNAWLLRLQLAGLRCLCQVCRKCNTMTRNCCVSATTTHVNVQWMRRESGKETRRQCRGGGGAQRVIDLLLLLLPLSCRATTRLPSFRFWPVQDFLELRPAFYSASFLPSACPSPSTLDQCDNNATSAVAFASARQTLCTSRPAAALQSAYPVTHTHALSEKCACACVLSVGPNAAYANVLTKHARPSICQVAKNQARIF